MDWPPGIDQGFPEASPVVGALRMGIPKFGRARITRDVGQSVSKTNRFSGTPSSSRSGVRAVAAW